MSDVVLAVRDLAFAYPDGRQVLYGVDLSVRRGERVAILGPNGAGKTTFVLHLNGTLGGGTGAITVDGLPVERANLGEIRRRVGIVFQDPDDQLFMPTVHDDVAFGPANLGLRGPELEHRVDAALAAVGMGSCADRAPHHLSFGQRRRVAASTVLSMDPSLLVLDEPSSNLDPLSRREFADLVLGLGLTTLIVTHDLLYALQLCPRSVIMNGGVIVADGPTPELLADTELLAANRLELPYGCTLPFCPQEIAPRRDPLRTEREMGLRAVLPADDVASDRDIWQSLAGFGPANLSVEPGEVDDVIYAS